MASSPPLSPPLAAAREASGLRDALTVRAVLCATVLGLGVCVANIYFGLQAGMVNAMPMQSALLGYAIFRGLQHRFTTVLTPMETTLIEIIAGSVGLAPFTSGLTSFIPALEFLATPEEAGHLRFSSGGLLLWSLATCGLGIITAAPFRNLFILRERLRFPSATATGTMISMLFLNGEHRSDPDMTDSRHPPEGSAEVSHQNHISDNSTLADDYTRVPDGDRNAAATKKLLVSLVVSAAFSLVAYLFPVLKRVPIFGLPAANNWVWALDLSPAYFGYGIIIGPTVNVYILLGAILGWGILSPVAKHRGWAPGPVSDWDHGSRGWILWTGMGLILGDTLVRLGWITTKPTLIRAYNKLRPIFRRNLDRSFSVNTVEQAPLLGNHSNEETGSDRNEGVSTENDWPKTSLINTALITWTACVLVIFYLLAISLAFSDVVSMGATIFSVVLIPIAGFMSIRALGETDNGASLAIGRLAQLMISLVVPPLNGKYTTSNLLLSGAVESGASQASQHMGGQRTAYMTKTAPRAVLYGQDIGSCVGVLLATSLYKIYTSVKHIPSDEFSVPDAHIYLVASRLLRQQGLPPQALNFAAGAFVFGAIFSIARIIGKKYWWRDLVPSGVAMGIGMYVVPAITLPRALGGIVLFIGSRRLGIDQFTFICSATGLILGQGLFSLVGLMFDALDAPVTKAHFASLG